MKAERTRFLKQTYDELREMHKKYGNTYSTASIQLMKQIIKLLEMIIHMAEMEKIKKEVADGKLTPKEVVKKKAASRKRYRR